jgi:hypothetical protein
VREKGVKGGGSSTGEIDSRGILATRTVGTVGGYSGNNGVVDSPTIVPQSQSRSSLVIGSSEWLR